MIAFGQKLKYFADHNGSKGVIHFWVWKYSKFIFMWGTHMKINFEYFQTQKWMLQTVRTEAVDEKNRVICLVSMFPSWIMVFNCLKKFIFCNSTPTSAKNLNLLKQFTYASERSRYALCKMVLFITRFFYKQPSC